jgi:hypothetical protein
MKRPSTLTIAVVAGALLLVSVFAFRRYLPYTGMSLAPRQAPAVVMSIEDAYIVGLGNNVKLWSIKAGTVDLAQNRFVVTLNHVTDGKIFDKGKPALEVRAGRIAYNISAQDMTLSGGVTIEGNEGQRITGPGATWNSFTGMLRSTGRVAFESKLGRMTAKTLVVDVRNRELTMWDVAGSMNLKAVEAASDKETRNAD